MESPKLKDADSKFPEADADGELNPGEQKSFDLNADEGAEATATSMQMKERVEVEDKKHKIQREKERRDSMQKLKTTIIMSGVIVAIVGAIFALTKKMREKN